MPRRIRLRFDDAEARRCGLTGDRDSVVVSSYRTRNYGVDYSEGFQHPLTPYYRRKATDVVKLAVHPSPGGISYRLWPGLVVPSEDRLREPAQVVRHWQERARSVGRVRFAAFGYDMDNMKARAWIEGEMPLLHVAPETRDWLGAFIRQVTRGADTVSRLVKNGVKAALCDNPKKATVTSATSRFGSIATRRRVLGCSRRGGSAIEHDPDGDDPTWMRERGGRRSGAGALRLFDEYAPFDGLETGTCTGTSRRGSSWCLRFAGAEEWASPCSRATSTFPSRTVRLRRTARGKRHEPGCRFGQRGVDRL